MAFTGKAKSIEEVFDILQIIENQNKEGNLLLNSEKENFTIKIKKRNIQKIETNSKNLKKLKDKENIPETWKSYFHYINIEWQNFYFNFEENNINENQNSIPISHFLLNFCTERDEISHIIKKLTKNPIGLTIRGELKEEKFDTVDLWVYGEIIKGTPIKEIIFGNIPLKGILKSINKLFKAGLIEVEILSKKETNNKTIDFDKIEKFEEFLAKIVGPVAGLLIFETLEELNLSNEKIPVNKAQIFIETVVNKIPEDCLFEGDLCTKTIKEKFFEIIGRN
ncbi:hypothetical protein Thein_0422 [Thermodesulfatator indicus DSM 15286]|uniref:DUF8082 domain-containing protein n=1 Tax=Thermodesulfatator indicus (strain DSM 15286 / JCM 11887 / CIR29812) TaxID=667014 RepID=F8AAN2_THEID|nr:hypothetical protein [Thermodesulfatator indicus]AEH44304.1 hypothetical protein Thein_0422 [Thermodesulfatator indicus DSM 15286]